MQKVSPQFLTSTSDGKIMTYKVVGPGLITINTTDQMSGHTTTALVNSSSALPPPGRLFTFATSNNKQGNHLPLSPQSVSTLEDFSQKSLSPCIFPFAFPFGSPPHLSSLLLSGPLLSFDDRLSISPSSALHLQIALAVFDHYATEELKKEVHPFGFVYASLKEPLKILYCQPSTTRVYTTSEPDTTLPMLVFTRITENQMLPILRADNQIQLEYVGENQTLLIPYEMFFEEVKM